MTHNRQFGTKTPIASRSRPLDIYLPKPKATLTTTAEISCTNDSDQEPHVRGNAPLHILYALPSKSHVFIIPTRNDIHILPRGCQSDIWQHFLRHSANLSTNFWNTILPISCQQRDTASPSFCDNNCKHAVCQKCCNRKFHCLLAIAQAQWIFILIAHF